MNRVTLIGRIGNDAETKQFDNGNVAVRFSLATSESWKGADGQKHEDTQWHRCTGLGERFQKLAPYITRGRLLMVEGKVKYRDADGHTYTDIEVRDIEFLSSGKDGGGAAGVATPTTNRQSPPRNIGGGTPAPAMPEPMQEGGLGDLPF